MSEILNEPAQSLLRSPNITFSGILEQKVSKLSFHYWIPSYVIILNGNIYIYDNCNSKIPRMSEILAIYDEIHIVQQRKNPPFWCFYLKPKFDKKPKIKFGAASEQEMMSDIEQFKIGILFSQNYSYPKDSQNSKGNSLQSQTQLATQASSHLNPPMLSTPNRTQLPPPPIELLPPPYEFYNLPNTGFNPPLLPYGHPTQISLPQMNNFSNGSNNIPNLTYNPQIPPYPYQPQFPIYPVINSESGSFPIANCSPQLHQNPINNASNPLNHNSNSNMRTSPPPIESQKPLPPIPKNDLSSRICSNDFIFMGTREDAVKELSKNHVIGSYLIRVDNERNVLTVQTVQGIVKYLLSKNAMNNKISIQGNENQFNNQLELVVFYTLNYIPNYNCKLTIPYKLVYNQN